ncbi:hypothetical protein N032_08600 [Pseudomonas syringae pv. pisi str. PP1]|uniref:hypothetical protein n=1 Tax=Pseudomonas syringae TaxID=317 RepID=UPI00046636B2|nr:hypothetical protein [Pseudomonas syringae]AZG85724.1 hypothetical protein N032_08600 [Pseudomonas syringae pv. pisi str. PP1]RMM22512.1 hypothetical protein ALQ81_101817 [Pseudomonas syringae pv. pisi]UZS64142.1 hypothetical protein OQB64_08250 [Pseudomonas syringae]
MKEYNSLIKFMLDLGTAIQDYLPEDQRTSPMSLIDFLEAWTGKKSYNEICMLRSDIRSYLRKHTQGDYSVDELFLYYDIGFVEERFGCEVSELLAQILGLLEVHIESRRKKALKKYFGWVGFK